MQRVQQPHHMTQCKVTIPSFDLLYEAVARYALAKYEGLEIMYFDLLHQGPNTSSVYNWHVDNDQENNPGGASIYRSLVVKISTGISVSVQVAGHAIMEYGDQAGSFSDFRSDAYHRSVNPESATGFTGSFKVVFFLGLRGRIEDNHTEGRIRAREKEEKKMRKRLKAVAEREAACAEREAAAAGAVAAEYLAECKTKQAKTHGDEVKFYHVQTDETYSGNKYTGVVERVSDGAAVTDADILYAFKDVVARMGKETAEAKAVAEAAAEATAVAEVTLTSNIYV